MSQRYVAFYGINPDGKLGTIVVYAGTPVHEWNCTVAGGQGILPMWHTLLTYNTDRGWNFISWRYIIEPDKVAAENDWAMRQHIAISLAEGRFVGTDLESSIASFDIDLQRRGYHKWADWAQESLRTYGTSNEFPEGFVLAAPSGAPLVPKKKEKPDLAQEWFAKTMLDPEASADLAKRAMEAVRAMSSGG